MKNKQGSYQLIRKILLLVFMAALAAVEMIYRNIDASSNVAEYIYLAATRVIGGAVCIIFILEFSFSKILDPLGNRSAMSLLTVLPAFAVAINNFPFVSFFAGECGLDAPIADVAVYGLFCLAVGFFEEMAFRGCVLMYLLKKRVNTRLGIFMAILWSSVAFGAVHLINLFTSSPGAVLLQLGYSALIGALCSVVLLETGNIWLCVILHAVYNFVGNVIADLGTGIMWTVPQMIFTAVIAVIVTGYTVWRFFKIPLDKAKELFI